MKLCKRDIRENKSEWLSKGYMLPEFDMEAVGRATHDAPEWIHFGAGNIFRAFIASTVQRLLNEGRLQKGLIVAEGYDYEIIDRAYRPFDDLCLSVTLKAEGSIEKMIVASVTESLKVDPADGDYARIREIFASPSLKMASFTITEKGYNIKSADGAVFPAIEKDFAAEWVRRGLVDAGFAGYVNDRAKVGFPWTMIDKITPRPDAKVIEMVRKDGFTDTDAVKTAKGTFVAPFVNAEETQYLVIEDWFPNGRVEIGGAYGVMYADRETVDKVERMKVCTCLNPLHTALAVYGCLLGYTLISEEMKDPQLKKMVEIIGYREGLPVVVDPGVLDPREFIDTVVKVRIPNVFMPDTPQRIATDTSQKLAIRFGETIKAYQKRPDLSVSDLKIIPLVFAGWLRYVMGVDDNGQPFTPSDDPMLAQIQGALAGIRLGDAGPFGEKLHPVLSNERIFGVDLYAAGLGELTENYFAQLVAGPGAVRRTLQKYLA